MGRVHRRRSSARAECVQRGFQVNPSVERYSGVPVQQPPPHLLQLLQAAGDAPALASAVANGFNHPPSFFPWWTDATACEAFIAEKSTRAAA